MVIKVRNLNNTEIKLNNIDEIYDLKNSENVIIINLSSENLTNLPENIFNNLTQLQGLYLSYNKLINLPENIFNNLTQLQELYLDNNNLTTIPEKIFNNLT
jgi:Leucine-rich repeat (LRR) protein